MEGDSAVQAVFGPEMEKLRTNNKPLPDELKAKIDQTRADYERWLDAKYAAARGHCDAVIDPLATRRYLEMAFDVACAHQSVEHLPLQLFAPPSELQ
jgi:acetyl-CoA carboxylase carboxyltransferase component